MDGRDAEETACSSGHPSQKNNYLDTRAPQKNHFVCTLPLGKRNTGSLALDEPKSQGD